MYIAYGANYLQLWRLGGLPVCWSVLMCLSVYFTLFFISVFRASWRGKLQGKR